MNTKTKEIIFKLSETLLFPRGCCIYKCHEVLRKWNEKAYTPQVISIGPFHHGRENLLSMEIIIRRYLQSFIKRQDTVDLWKLITGTIQRVEGNIRKSYSEPIPLGNDECVEIIAVDASFIIEFSLRCYGFWPPDEVGAVHIIEIHIEGYHDDDVIRAIMSDLLLLENQLPFFVIDALYTFAVAHFRTQSDLPTFPPCIELSFRLFRPYNLHDMLPNPNSKKLHFTDLHRYFLLLPLEKRPKRGKNLIVKIYSATELAMAGLKFKAGSKYNHALLELKYSIHSRQLEIPRFPLDYYTEIYCRNLMAYEQCHYADEAYITDYFVLLHFLITTGKALELLTRLGIIETKFDHEAGALMINKLCANMVCSSMNTDYYEISKGLNKFYEMSPVQRWNAALKR